MSDIGKLIGGFHVFKSTTYERKKDIIHHLLELGHKPTTMVISCSDIRLSPAELFATNPGDLYVVSNIGGLVPKYTTSGVHGILSAIEYAVMVLEVENIIVLGHAKCHGIKMMMSEKFAKGNISESMKAWLSIAAEAYDVVKKEMSDKSEEDQQSCCERESVIVSLRNLTSYPYVSKRMSENKLNIFGWHFDIESGEIESFNPDAGVFEVIS